MAADDNLMGPQTPVARSARKSGCDGVGRSSHFEGVQQAPITLAGRATRVPVLYYDATGITAVFPARRRGLRSLLPDPALTPARLLPGIGLIAISGFKYRDSDIGDYNEIVVSVIVKDPAAGGNLPGQAIIRALRRRQFHAHVRHLPVTSEAARVLGCDLCGLPKFIGGVDFSLEADSIRCRLSEADEHILTLCAARLARGHDDQLQVFSHQRMKGRLRRTEFKLHATPLATTTRPGTARLELGAAHPIAVELDGLLLSKRSVHHQQMERFEGILYDPDHPAP